MSEAVLRTQLDLAVSRPLQSQPRRNGHCTQVLPLPAYQDEATLLNAVGSVKLKLNTKAEDGKEVLDMCKAFQEIEANGEKKGEKNARSDDLKKLVSNTGWSLDRAMETLDIPQEEWEDYRALVQ